MHPVIKKKMWLKNNEHEDYPDGCRIGQRKLTKGKLLNQLHLRTVV